MCQADTHDVRLSLDGRPEAFRRLVERHQGRLLSYLTGRLGDREAAAEAAQEAFVRAFFRLRALRSPEAFFSWLVGIATRVAKEMGRADRRRQAVPLDQVAVVADGGARDPSELTRAVAALPERYRQVVLLRFYAGLSCREISGQLAVPIGTVTKRLSRAYAMLRESLRGHEDTGDGEVRP